MASQHILPDSRARESKGSKMVDWAMPDGTTRRIEVEICYCANCGKPSQWVPKDNTAAAFYLCDECFEKYGAIAGTCAVSDQQFCENVVQEMLDAHGRPLTDLELFKLMEQGELGTGLELLMRESPYKVYKPSD
jgi:hypothetical protein